MAKRGSAESYRIERIFRNDHPKRVIKRHLTWAEAQEHCRDPETSSSTCTKKACLAMTQKYGAWFDSIVAE